MPGHVPFLLVEDQEDDALMIQRAFIRARVLNPLFLVSSGEQAVAYLAGAGVYSDRARFPLPRLVLLDIKMPGMNGFEVLKWIRHLSLLPQLRVVMLTSSDDMRDVQQAYEMGAHSFLIKPIDFEKFVEVSQALNGYWNWFEDLPRHPGSLVGDPVTDTDFLRRRPWIERGDLVGRRAS